MKKIPIILIFIFCFALGIYGQTIKTESAVELEKINERIEKTENAKKMFEIEKAALLVRYTGDYAKVKEVQADISILDKRLTKLNERKKELKKLPKIEKLPNNQIQLLKIIISQNQRIIELLEAQSNNR